MLGLFHGYIKHREEIRFGVVYDGLLTHIVTSVVYEARIGPLFSGIPHFFSVTGRQNFFGWNVFPNFFGGNFFPKNFLNPNFEKVFGK